jgi:hypothetical protein
LSWQRRGEKCGEAKKKKLTTQAQYGIISLLAIDEQNDSAAQQGSTEQSSLKINSR